MEALPPRQGHNERSDTMTHHTSARSDELNPASTDDDIIRQALTILEDRAKYAASGSELSNPQATRDLLRLKLSEHPREVFACLFLDNQHRLISYEELFFGTIDGCSVHPREVVIRALANNAAAVIFAHKHPSGVAEPSQADQQITERLKSALQLVDVRVLDHMIVGDGAITSFAERGLL